MTNIMTVLGTRPEMIKLSCIIKKLDNNFKHSLVHTGQHYHYELNKVFFKELNIRKPDYFLNAAKKTAADTIGNIISSFDKILIKKNPDAILILGDTNSSLVAIPAKRRRIPIFHLEAGNRCFDFRVPEEINRKIVDHISDINLTYSQIAKDYLIKEGISADRIIKVGSPMLEVLNNHRYEIGTSKILKKLKLKEKKYFLISFHREENVEAEINIKKFINVLIFLKKKYKFPIIVSTHFRTKKKIKKYIKTLGKNIVFHKPFGFFDYIKLQESARVVLSDSGTITEEASILNFGALNLRESYERPEGMEEGAVMLTGLNIKRIKNGIKILDKQSQLNNMEIVNDYNVKNVSEKIVKIINSHIDYINHKVWFKNLNDL